MLRCSINRTLMSLVRRFPLRPLNLQFVRRRSNRDGLILMLTEASAPQLFDVLRFRDRHLVDNLREIFGERQYR